MKKIFIFIISISFAALTSVITLNTSSLSWTISVSVSYITALIILNKFQLLEKNFNKPFLYKGIDIIFSIALTIFTIINLLNSFKNNNSYLNVFVDRIINIFSLPNSFHYHLIIFAFLISGMSIFFIYFYLVRHIYPIIKKFIKSLSMTEKYFIILSTLILSIFIVIIYSSTSVFYYPVNIKAERYDVIYTTDTGVQIESDSFKNFSAPENDIRQPLFALFSYPFGLLSSVGAKVYSHFFNNYIYFYSVFIVIFQIICLNIIAILLARMVCKKNSLLFKLIYCLSFPFLLFVFNIEQYVFGLFWLIILIYYYVVKNKFKVLLFYASAGSLITNSILLPFLTFKKPIKKYIISVIKYGLLFIVLAIVFGQYDTVFFVKTPMNALLRFAGTDIGYQNKIIQFSNFVLGCFIAPKSEINLTRFMHPSYQLVNNNSFNIIGFLIFIICIISFLMNKKEKIVRISFGWTLLSILILVIVGWGTMEKCLIIYSLYFSWSYLILLYKFFDKLFGKNNYILMICIIICFLVLNVQSIYNIVKFGIEFYPFVFHF